MKLLVNLLCCFVPSKKWRKAIKRKLFGTNSRRKRLIAHGCTIENEVLTTPEGVKVDISNVPHEALGITKEVFLHKDYGIIFSFESILIDIGLNRGIASLFFAKYPNIQKIYGYEPFKPTFELAKRNLELNPSLSEKINAYNFGLGKTETTLELPYIDQATGGMSTTHDVCKDFKNIRTETVIIKDVAKEFFSILEENKNKRVIVKCDCEGAEFDIFERLNENGIFEKIDLIMMEYHFDSPEKLTNILAENGFAIQVKSSSSKSKTGYIYAVRTAERIC